MRQQGWPVLLVGCGIVIAVGACSGARLRQPPKTGMRSQHVGQDSVLGTHQSLYRVQVSGPSGSGGLRLVLRAASQAHFQLATADTLGRKLWSLERRDSRTVLVDHRERIFCQGEGDLRLHEITLQMLPLTAIPRVLQGELPVDLVDGVVHGSSTEYRDTDGHRWSVRREGETIVAWTMWAASKTPTLWWTRQDNGGILSHHEGSQFRWRQVVSEDTGIFLEPLRAPEGFSRVSCDDYDFPEFRQDQSSSAGEGTPR